LFGWELMTREPVGESSSPLPQWRKLPKGPVNTYTNALELHRNTACSPAGWLPATSYPQVSLKPTGVVYFREHAKPNTPQHDIVFLAAFSIIKQDVVEMFRPDLRGGLPGFIEK